MPFSGGFRGIGQGAKRDAQRVLRGQRAVAGGTQGDSPHNASVDAVVGLVAMLATQYPDALIEGSVNGRMGDFDGRLSLQVSIREARQGEADALEEERKEGRRRAEEEARGVREGAARVRVPQSAQPAPPGSEAPSQDQDVARREREKAAEKEGGNEVEAGREPGATGEETQETTNGTPTKPGSPAGPVDTGRAAQLPQSQPKPQSAPSSPAVGQRTGPKQESGGSGGGR
jgi:hypothetical protein